MKWISNSLLWKKLWKLISLGSDQWVTSCRMQPKSRYVKGNEISIHLSVWLCSIILSVCCSACHSTTLYPVVLFVILSMSYPFVILCLYLPVILSLSYVCRSIYMFRYLFYLSFYLYLSFYFYVCFSLCQTAYGMYPLSDVACFSSMLCSHSHKCPILSGSLSDWCWL